MITNLLNKIRTEAKLTMTTSTETKTSFRKNWIVKRSSSTSSDDSARFQISEDQTKSLLRLKLVAVSVLVISAVGLATAGYLFLRNGEKTKFSEFFHSDATKILESIGLSTKKSLRILDGAAVVAISYATFGNRTFPDVTIPDFGTRAAKYRSSCGGIVFSYLPVVTDKTRLAWEEYAWSTSSEWVYATKTIQSSDAHHPGGAIMDGVSEQRSIYDTAGNSIPYNSTRMMLPLWTNYPIYNPSFNYDWFSGVEANSATAAIRQRKAVMSEAYMLPNQSDTQSVIRSEEMRKKYEMMVNPGEDPGEPISNLIYPIINRLDSVVIPSESTKGAAVAIIAASIYWRDVLKHVLPDSSRGIHVVFENPCNPSFTYQIDGDRATYLGRGDLHQSKFNRFKISKILSELPELQSADYTGFPLNSKYCPFTFNIYPSEAMENLYITSSPIWVLVSVLILFIFVGIIFVVYDMAVERRQIVIVNVARKTNAIVSSLFPSAVRDQLLQTQAGKRLMFQGLDGMNKVGSGVESKRMAHLYRDSSVFYCDFAGFTAWSSTRNPDQVFLLLETVYSAFDQIARQRKVFKVETIGDCYVAATGVPDADKDHAVRMTRFAFDCLQTVNRLVVELVANLGPDTSDLTVRIGLSSGPVTAGVLRGDKARFQLFGETANTASKLENTCIPGRIQASQETANLLIAAGKDGWITVRDDIKTPDGQEIEKTYWVHPKRFDVEVFDISQNNHEGSVPIRSIHQAMQSRIGWNTGVLLSFLKLIVAKRSVATSSTVLETEVNVPLDSGIPLDIISQTIDLSTFGANDDTTSKISAEVNIPKEVERQLQELVSIVASLYKENPFHNFDHASHVVMSTTKLLSRIINPGTAGTVSQTSVWGQNSTWSKQKQLQLDPLTQFAIVFSALVHDVDHSGVSNFQLVQENSSLAKRYRGKCVAEQNSIDITWNLLMQPSFTALRNCIASTTDELQYFRQILVNLVLATDIFDKDLKTLRESRWNNTFSDTLPIGDDLARTMHHNRMGAIIIEFIIQASDVSHTMQHWTIYQKWNEKLFHEMYIAYRLGKSPKDPTDGWYNGELWFFDNYIIPLAEKLKVCGVFGVSCDEFLDYAIDNRLEWEMKGQQITTEFLQRSIEVWEEKYVPKDDNDTINDHDDDDVDPRNINFTPI